MIRYICITEEAIKALDRFCKDLRSAEVSSQLLLYREGSISVCL